MLSAKPGGVKIHADGYDRMGCDDKGTWFGQPPESRRNEVNNAQVVYGTTVHRGDVWCKGALFFDDRRVARSSLFDNSWPRYFMHAAVLETSSFYRNLSPRFLNGKDFLHVIAERNGMLSVLNSGDAPYTSMIWNVSGVHVQGNLTVSGKLTATEKAFATPHPVRPEAELVHACLEGPENAVTYRGEAALVAGLACTRPARQLGRDRGCHSPTNRSTSSPRKKSSTGPMIFFDQGPVPRASHAAHIGDVE